jgi:hypothetical protein
VNVLEGHSIGHCKQKSVHMIMCPIPNSSRDRTMIFHCTVPKLLIRDMTNCFYYRYLLFKGTRGNVIGCPDKLDFFFLIYLMLSSRTMTLGSTQPLTEMSTRNLPGGIGRPAHKPDNLKAICEPIV